MLEKKRNFNEVNKFVNTITGPAIKVTLTGSETATGSVYFTEGTSTELEAFAATVTNPISVSITTTGVAGSYLMTITVL